MKIAIATRNKLKVHAVTQTVKLYPHLFLDPEIVSVDTNVPVFGHPKTLKGTMEGAIARAKDAFVDCEYSVGLEGGLMEVPYTETGFMEVSACAIYDGKELCLGLSPAFEWPKAVTNAILSGENDGNQAFKNLGFTTHEKLGSIEGGGIGLITDNKLKREDCIIYSIMAALARLGKPEMYKV